MRTARSDEMIDIGDYYAPDYKYGNYVDLIRHISPSQNISYVIFCPCTPNAWMWCQMAYAEMMKARYSAPHY